jgi:uncharacterized small protein (DUF1192 family)
MARPHDIYSGVCDRCGNPWEIPCRLFARGLDGVERSRCRCGAEIVVQFRPPDLLSISEIRRRRAKLSDELEFQCANLHIARTRPKLIAEVQGRIAELEAELADLPPEAA